MVISWPKKSANGPSQIFSTLLTIATRAREQWPLLRVLTGTHRAHRREVTDEVRRAGDQLQALRGKAADEVQLVAFPPVAQGQGPTEVLSSCMIISEGTDIPSVAGAILMRPTASLSLYLQMVGRALRPTPGKLEEAVILDHVGNAHRHGLPTDEREWNLAGRPRREGVSIPIKDCPVCFCSCPSAAQVCPDCSHLFLGEERDVQRRGLQQVEGELVEVTGAARHRPKPKQQQQRPRRTHPAAGLPHLRGAAAA